MRLAACLLLAALIAPAAAAPADADGARELRPLHQGYDFDRPGILLRQRLFGLAHGLSLLAAACLDEPMQSAAAQEAYASWLSRQATSVDNLVRDLALHYFGPRAGEADWGDLVRALNLPGDIRPALAETQLEDACRTLPTVLIRERYDFARQLEDAERSQATGTNRTGEAAK